MIKVEYDLCVGCLSCYKVCPLKALGVNGGRVILERPANCISCGHCTSVCPRMAINDKASASRPGGRLEGNTPFPMEEVERLLITRRSIRRYDAQPVQLEKIERLLYLASQAPTAENRRERGFVVVGPKGCAELELMIKKYYSRRLSDDIGQLIKDSGYEVLLGAPHLIGLYDRAEEELWDCALAAQNFVLAAHGMGLGTCYNGIFKDIYEDDDNIRDYLRLPEGYEMKVFVVLGYPERDIVYHHAIERLQPETIWKY